ncbi:uncharacterized protein [Argopecten irradians]|uniref:uncharacterized protein n=1 Tax=Argopecten irradians TaxID=31199 RepID=UPI00371E64B0
MESISTEHSASHRSQEVSETPSLQTSESDSFEVIGSSASNEDGNVDHVPLENKDLDAFDVSENKTLANVPGKPVAREIGCDSVLLEWRKPSKRDITYYEVRLKTKSETTWQRPVFTDFDKPSHHIRGLDPDTDYEFKVRAHYQDGEGDFSELSDLFKTKVQVHQTSSLSMELRQKPGKPIVLDVKEDHVKLGWDRPEDKNVKFYEIIFRSQNDGIWSQPIFTEKANTFYMVDGLKPATRYHFKVKTHYRSGGGEYSEESDVARTLDAKLPLDTSTGCDMDSSTQPGRPAALDVGFDYVCIAWDKPDKSDVEYYEVKMKTTDDDCWFKTPSFTEGGIPYKVVNDLAQGTEYEFKVRGHYDEDEGQFSDKSDPIMTKQPSVLTADIARTTLAKPVMRKPGKPCSLAVYSDSVVLRWDAPSEKNVSYYELKSKILRRKAWDKVPVFTDDDKTFLRVTGLESESQYVFKVRAHFQEEEGQFSDVSDIISTSGNMNMEEQSMSVLEFQDKYPPAKDVSLGFTSDSSAGYRVPYHPNRRDNPEHTVHWHDMARETYGRLVHSRKDDYLFHGSSVDSFHVNEQPPRAQRQDIHYNNQVSKDFQNKCSRRPGKPTRADSGSDYIRLAWKVPDDENVLYYEMKYKQTQEELWSKESAITSDTSPNIYVRGLLQDTEYEFKVRGHYKDGEGEYSGQSESIRTLQSPALSVRQACMKLQDGEPAFYKVPLTEHKQARSEEFKTRKCEFGSSHLTQEKTIMMIGATGSGKSTLIDGMVNHLLGVKWEDDFRFKIIDLMSEEEVRKGVETESQTDWITSYRVHPMNEDVKFICNIIDTPGFGDTRGIHRDHQLVDQIRAFFNTKGAKGIETIDAICFVTQAPLARLTHTQRYIYDSILSIFGKDMKDNIVAMVTFADGKEPPVLNALKKADIPIKMHFIFNNSALFEPNTDAKCNRFGKMFWEMGFLSYRGFFKFLPNMKTQSLQLTAEVLNKREQLNTTVTGLLPQIDMGLCELATMRTERELIEKFDREIKDNQNFTYEVDEFQQHKVDLNPGEYVTNCTYCHLTCHYPCLLSDDSDKIRCAAMNAGKCTVCPQKCNWTTHKNNDFRIEITQVKVKKTYEQMKKKLEIAKEAKVTKQHVIRRLGDAFNRMKNSVLCKIDQVRNCGNYLRKNAIKANPLTEIEYLDVLIESAQQEKKAGFQERVSMLKSLKRAAELKAKSVDLTPLQILEEFGLHDMDM